MIELKLYKPNYFLVPINESLLEEYNLGFSLGDIFKVKGAGILTAADELLINTKLDKLKTNIDEFLCGTSQIQIGETTKSKLKDQSGTYKLFPYRIFDNRFIYDSEIVNRRKKELTKHEQIESNMYLNFKPSVLDSCSFSHILITKYTSDNILFKGKKASHTAPLYILNEGESSND